MIEKIKKYICAVCGQEYGSLNEAIDCQKNNGQEKVLYERGLQVEVKFNNDIIVGTIITHIFTKPGNPANRQPHTVLYLLKVDKHNELEFSPTNFVLTTASQDEIMPILDDLEIIE